jgi:hypothetical protein
MVAADPLIADRVNVYEESESEEQLQAFRNSGLESSMFSLIARFDVSRHVVTSLGPP